jgi:hypothetical protein
MNCKDCSKYKLCLYINNGNEEKLSPCKNFNLPNGYLFVSKDFIKHRPHIHYLMKHSGHNSAGVIATYNSKKKTITLKEEAFDLCTVADDFVRLSLEDVKGGGKE